MSRAAASLAGWFLTTRGRSSSLERVRSAFSPVDLPSPFRVRRVALGPLRRMPGGKEPPPHVSQFGGGGSAGCPPPPPPPPPLSMVRQPLVKSRPHRLRSGTPWQSICTEGHCPVDPSLCWCHNPPPMEKQKREGGGGGGKTAALGDFDEWREVD